MKKIMNHTKIATIVAAAACALLINMNLMAGTTKPQGMTGENPEPARLRTLAMKLERNLSLALQTPGVEWSGNKYHLLRLSEIRFTLEQETGHLKAEVKASGISFDKVDYDISVAVFDTAGELLGVARVPCNLTRVWLGKPAGWQRTIALDFGRSLDYPRASSFMVSISHRKVLTPDDYRVEN